MIRNRLLALAGCLLVLLTATGSIHAATSLDDIVDRIRTRLRHSGRHIRVGKATLYNNKLVRQFYEEREFQPAWNTEFGPAPLAEEMLQAIRLSRFDGLEPTDYHFVPLSRMQQISDNEGLLADWDLLLTDAFLQLCRHLKTGKSTRFASIAPDAVEGDELQLDRLERVLRNDKLFLTLDRLNPATKEYESLRRALGRYLRIEKKGGWSYISLGEVLRKGDRDNRIRQIRERLELTGDLDRGSVDPGLESEFDDYLETAIVRFQRRHGLRKTGILDRRTRLAMNMPLEKRILQIRLNMNLRRIMSGLMRKPYVLVNIPAMELLAFRDNRRPLEMRVIVGKPKHPTPIFSDEVPFLIINPYWYVPPEIIKQEILPAVRTDPGYLAARGFHLFRKMSADQDEVQPEEVDWETISPEEIDFYFRQNPGRNNALGVVKFIIPNRKHIYLHDTPSKALFNRQVRALSFGCIRLGQPLDLATFMLADDPDWTRSGLRQLIESGYQRRITLPQPMAIHVVYWTVRIDQQSRLRFYPDIYDLEAGMIADLTR